MSRGETGFKVPIFSAVLQGNLKVRRIFRFLDEYTC